MMTTTSGNGGASTAGIDGLVQPSKSKSSPTRSGNIYTLRGNICLVCRYLCIYDDDSDVEPGQFLFVIGSPRLHAGVLMMMDDEMMMVIVICVCTCKRHAQAINCVHASVGHFSAVNHVGLNIYE